MKMFVAVVALLGLAVVAEAGEKKAPVLVVPTVMPPTLDAPVPPVVTQTTETSPPVVTQSTTVQPPMTTQRTFTETTTVQPVVTTTTSTSYKTTRTTAATAVVAAPVVPVVPAYGFLVVEQPSTGLFGNLFSRNKDRTVLKTRVVLK